MRVCNLRVTNFRSLRDFHMENIGNLSVLIGRNGAGKSNILEAIEVFLRGIAPSFADTDANVSDYIWSRQEAAAPITFSFTLDLTEEELALDHELTKEFFDFGNTDYRVEITKELVKHPKKAWKLILLTLNGFPICDDGIPVDSAIDENAPLRKIGISVFTRIASLVESSLKIVGFNRIGPSLGAALGQRMAVIPTDTVQSIVQIERSPDPEKDSESYELRNQFGDMNPGQELHVSGSTLMVREGSIRIPLPFAGVGTQTIIGLIHELQGDADILCIEEPELHLHAELQRKVFSRILQISETSQVFVTTHSTTFLDECQYGDIWHIRKAAGATTARKAQNLESLHLIGSEMGIRPSDVLVANNILFVEGNTEKILFPSLAQLMGMKLQPPGVSIIPMRGISKGRYHLAVWNEVASMAGIPRFVILDGDADAKREAKRAIEKNLISEDRVYTLSRKSIEDYYPETLIYEALTKEYSFSSEQEEQLKQVLRGESRARDVRRLLHELNLDKNGVWKTLVALYVAEKMKPEDLEPEIRDLVLKVENALMGNAQPYRTFLPPRPDEEKPTRRSITGPSREDSANATLRDFYVEKSPQTRKDEVLLFYYWMNKVMGVESPSYEDIRECYENVAVSQPSRIRAVVQRLVQDGLLIAGHGDGLYRISLGGERYIKDELPSRTR